MLSLSLCAVWLRVTQRVVLLLLVLLCVLSTVWLSHVGAAPYSRAADAAAASADSKDRCEDDDCYTTAESTATADFLQVFRLNFPALAGYWSDVTGNFCELPGIACWADRVEINISAINLVGSLPVDEFRDRGRLILMSSIDISDNVGVVGELPAAWRWLSRLQHVMAVGTSLSGSLPESWGELPQLTTLDLRRTALSGTLPEEWADLAELQTLLLGSTAVNGTIPESWSRLTKVVQVDLSGTGVTGCLPRAWVCDRNLTEEGVGLAGDGPVRCPSAEALCTHSASSSLSSSSLSSLSSLSSSSLSSSSLSSSSPPLLLSSSSSSSSSLSAPPSTPHFPLEWPVGLASVGGFILLVAVLVALLYVCRRRRFQARQPRRLSTAASSSTSGGEDAARCGDSQETPPSRPGRTAGSAAAAPREVERGAACVCATEPPEPPPAAATLDEELDTELTSAGAESVETAALDCASDVSRRSGRWSRWPDTAAPPVSSFFENPLADAASQDAVRAPPPALEAHEVSSRVDDAVTRSATPASVPARARAAAALLSALCCLGGAPLVGRGASPTAAREAGAGETAAEQGERISASRRQDVAGDEDERESVIVVVIRDEPPRASGPLTEEQTARLRHLRSWGAAEPDFGPFTTSTYTPPLSSSDDTDTVGGAHLARPRSAASYPLGDLLRSRGG